MKTSYMIDKFTNTDKGIVCITEGKAEIIEILWRKVQEDSALPERQ